MSADARTQLERIEEQLANVVEDCYQPGKLHCGACERSLTLSLELVRQLLTETPNPIAFPERANYGCVDCGSINHTTGDASWCLVAQAAGEKGTS